MANGVDPEAKFRATLAISIVLVGFIGMFTVSGLAIWLVGDAGRPEMMRLVFASILPLLGTWVGTVLAFYFARESLQAATDSTARLMGRLDPQAPVDRVMVPMNRILAKTVNSEAEAKAVPLTELMTLMKSRKVHRIPIFDTSNAVLLVVHDSTINAYGASLPATVAAPPAPGSAQPASAPPTPLDGKTVADLLGVRESEKLIKAIAVVGPAATVAEARAVMGSVEDCNDVFVTKDGKRKDPVEGWLTNTDLAGWR